MLTSSNPTEPSLFLQQYNNVSESISGPFRVRFEFRLKHWIRSWVSEMLEECHSFWVTKIAYTSSCLEQLLDIGTFSNSFWYILDSSPTIAIFCISLVYMWWLLVVVTAICLFKYLLLGFILCIFILGTIIFFPSFDHIVHASSDT